MVLVLLFLGFYVGVYEVVVGLVMSVRYVVYGSLFEGYFGVFCLVV